MSKRDVHQWLCTPYNENSVIMDLVFDVRDLIKITLNNLGLEIKNYTGDPKENENIFLMNLIEYIYINRNPYLWYYECGFYLKIK